MDSDNKEKVNNSNLPKNEDNLIDSTRISTTDNFISNCKHFIRLFLKMFGLRTVYSLFLMIRSIKKPLTKITLMEILKSIFNKPNFRTCLSIGLLPFIFQNSKLIFDYILFFKNHQNFTVFISGFISAFISILIEEKTKLVNYLILSIMVRTIHSIILIIFKKYNIFQNTGKWWDYFVFLFSAILLWGVYFLNPGFTPITSLLDAYANYRNEAEKLDAIGFRNSTRIV